jgi:predicted GIY-YIG superfamily endonuclease
MDAKFLSHVESLKPQLDRLLGMQPVTPLTMPKDMPKRGVYLLSEDDKPLYVGRSNNIKQRIKRHSLPGASHNKATFAFRLARIETGNLKATYKKDEGSRDALMKDAKFVAEFDKAKVQIRKMNLRFVEETDPVRQALLEIYVAITLETPHNDFDNH